MAAKNVSTEKTPRDRLREELMALRYGRGITANQIKRDGVMARTFRTVPHRHIKEAIRQELRKLAEETQADPRHVEALENAYNFEGESTTLDERRENYMISVNAKNRKTVIRWEDEALNALLDRLFPDSRSITCLGTVYNHRTAGIVCQEFLNVQLEIPVGTRPIDLDDFEAVSTVTYENPVQAVSLPAILYQLPDACDMLSVGAAFYGSLPSEAWGSYSLAPWDMVFGTTRFAVEQLVMSDSDADLMLVCRWYDPKPGIYGLCWHWEHPPMEGEASEGQP